MKSKLNEFKLIQDIHKQFKNQHNPHAIGIGDDCAVLPLSETHSQLVTTDLLIENVHFVQSEISPQELGHKALAVNLSDIAAMGGDAQAVFLSIAIPPETNASWLKDFFKGFHKLTQQYQIDLLGGDTSRSEHALFVNVTVLGTILNSQIKLRSGARPQDLICVSGSLGDSLAGLKILLENKERNSTSIKLIHKHHCPQPRLKQGSWLSKQSSVHAMMDLSDGLQSDLTRILKASQCQAIVNLERLPLSPELQTICQHFNWIPHEIAAIGGEDYELLLTIDPKDFSDVSERYKLKFHTPLFPIGTIDPQSSQTNPLQFKLNGAEVTLSNLNFEHF